MTEKVPFCFSGWLLVTLQRFNAILLHQSFVGSHEPDL